MHLLSLAGVIAPLALLVAGPGTAVGEPAPEAFPPVPTEVAAWFAAAAGVHVREASDVLDLPDGELVSVSVGAPRVVRTWADGFVAGTSLDPVSVPLEEWVAPVVVPSAEQPAPVGTVRAWLDPDEDDAVSLAMVDGDVELATALLSVDPALPFILDAPLDGWFSSADGEVWPLTSGAEEVLIGAVPLEAFQPLVVERHEAAAQGDVDLGGGAPSASDEDPGPALVVVLGVVLLAAAAGVVVVRQHRRTDSRLDADVRGDAVHGERDPGGTGTHRTDADADAGAPLDAPPRA